MLYLLQISAICAGCVVSYALLRNFLFERHACVGVGSIAMDRRDWGLFASLVFFVLLFCAQSGPFFKKLFADDYPLAVFSYAVAYQSVVLLCIFIFKKLSFAKVCFPLKFDFHTLKLSFRGFALAVGCSFCSAIITNVAVFVFTGEFPKKQDVVEIFSQTKSVGTILLAVFSFVVFAPVCEELFFRGLLYRMLKNSLEAVVAKRVALHISAICCAVIFALSHGNAFAFVPLFIVALILTSLYERTGSIVAPVLCHSMFNLFNALAMLIVNK